MHPNKLKTYSGIMLIFSTTCGFIWSIIFIIFSLLNGMPKMFGKEFFFLLANLFKIKPSTIISGFIFSFIDAFVLSATAGLIFLVAKNILLDKGR